MSPALVDGGGQAVETPVGLEMCPDVDMGVDPRRHEEAAVLTAGSEHPGRVEPVDVGRSDLVQPHEALAVVVAPVGEPGRVVGGGILEIQCRHRLRRSHGAPEGHYDERHSERQRRRTGRAHELPPQNDSNRPYQSFLISSSFPVISQRMSETGIDPRLKKSSWN